jgi:hypothetical protein
MGRYCLHFHMVGNAPLNYFRNNSIHDSFQRATTVHGTNYATVENNFAFRINGHTYFVEDGAESYNTFEHNLGVWTRKTYALLESDLKPATFWMSSANNFWRNNIAAGSELLGYWFELPGNPGGPSFTTSVCPVHSFIGEFMNNVAHSNAGHGMRVYPLYDPLENPCLGGATSPQFISNFTSYRNYGNGIFNKRVGDLHYINAKLLENAAEEFHWFKYIGPYDTTPNVVNMLCVAHTDPDVVSNKRAMWLPQTENFQVSGATFVNYGDFGAISGCASCDSDAFLAQGGYTVRFDGLRFVNTTRRTKWTAPFKDIFVDLDGSLTGHVNGSVSPFFAFNQWPECVANLTMFDGGIACDGSVRTRRLQVDNVDPAALDFLQMRITSSVGTGVINYLPKEISGWVAPVVTHHGYNNSFISPIDWLTMRIRYSEPTLVDMPNEWMQIGWNYTNYRYSYDVKTSAGNSVLPVTPIDSLSVSDKFGTSRLTTNTSWHVVLTNHGLDSAVSRNSFPGPYSVSAKAVLCDPKACGLPGNVPLGPPVFWSNPASWPSGKVPVAGENVNITAGTYMVMDISPPALGVLIVFGKLQFDDNADRTLTAKNILVWGTFQVGDPARPFAHRAAIVLTGLPTDPSLVAANSLNFDLGNRVMAVFGSLVLVGTVPNVMHVQLNATANAGDTTVVLVSPVDWHVGDLIVFSATEYGAYSIETRTIASISADGLTIGLNQSLAYRHYAGDVSYGSGSKRLAARVGHLSRNIVVQPAATAGLDYYGANIAIADAVFTAGTVVGSAYLDGVQFDRCGKQTYSDPCLRFEFTSTLKADSSPRSTVRRSAFSNTLNHGIASVASLGLTVESNVMHRSFRNSIDVDQKTTLVNITGNLIVGNLRSPDYTNQWIQPFSGLYINTVNYAAIQNNVISGSEDTGITIRPELCTTTSPVFLNNEVQGALVGLYILPRSNTCVQVRNFVAWKCAHLGIVTVDQTSNVQLQNVTVSDNHIGISLNFIQGSNAVTINRADINQSFIFGSTPASTCAASVSCRAMNKTDIVGVRCSSVFGEPFRRVGLISSQYLNAAKSCEKAGGVDNCRPPNLPERLCSMPWEKRHGLPSANFGKIVVTNTAIAYFSESDCGKKSVAYTINPSQVCGTRLTNCT